MCALAHTTPFADMCVYGYLRCACMQGVTAEIVDGNKQGDSAQPASRRGDALVTHTAPAPCIFTQMLYSNAINVLKHGRHLAQKAHRALPETSHTTDRQQYRCCQLWQQQQRVQCTVRLILSNRFKCKVQQLISRDDTVTLKQHSGTKNAGLDGPMTSLCSGSGYTRNSPAHTLQ